MEVTLIGVRISDPCIEGCKATSTETFKAKASERRGFIKVKEPIDVKHIIALIYASSKIRHNQDRAGLRFKRIVAKAIGILLCWNIHHSS